MGEECSRSNYTAATSQLNAEPNIFRYVDDYGDVERVWKSLNAERIENMDVEEPEPTPESGQPNLPPMDEDSIAIGSVDDDWIYASMDGEPSEIDLPFVSENQSENEDNEDPEWELMKKIENDDERYKLVRKRWKSLVVPDPNINLTSHKYRMMRTAVTSPVCGKRKKRSDGNEQDPKRMRSCTEYFDSEITKVEWYLTYEMNKLKDDYDMRKEWLQSEFRTRMFNIQICNFPRREEKAYISFLQDQFQLAFDELHTTCDMELVTITRPFNSRICKMRKAKEEVLTFNTYYSCLKNSSLSNVDRTLLDENRYNEIKTLERVYRMYDYVYTVPK